VLRRIIGELLRRRAPPQGHADGIAPQIHMLNYHTLAEKE
jgi:hypothetical protein